MSASPLIAASVEVEVALLDPSGTIIAVNNAWRRFAENNGGDPARTGIGMSYLDLCAAADPVSQALDSSIRAAIDGDLPAPVAVELPRDAPGSDRRFGVLVSSRLDDDGSCLGATVTLSPVIGRSFDHELRQRSEDRERIAADLQDHAVENLLAVGVGLQNLVPRLGGTDERGRVEKYIDVLDETIRQIHGSIYRIQTPVFGSADPLKFRLLNVLDEQTVRSQLDVGIEFAGALDHDLPVEVEDELVTVVRESLRIAQLARATSVQVLVAASPSALVVRVSDDGPGIGGPGRWDHLTGLRGRSDVASSVTVASTGLGHTRLVWTLPVGQTSEAAS